MAHYTIVKERNIVKFIDENNTFYALDINSGDFFGKIGKPIKTCPIATQSCGALYNLNTNLSRIIIAMFSKCHGSTAKFKSDEWVKLLGVADKLDGMNIPNLDYNHYEYQNFADHFDILVKYLKIFPYDTHSSNWDFRRNFDTFVKMQEFLKTRPNFFDYANIEIWRDVYGRVGNHITDEEWDIVLYYLCKQKVWEYDGNSNRVLDYIRYCKAMEKPFVKQSNFMREFLETRNTYTLYKTEFDDKLLRKSYAEHSKAFEFAFGDYVVVVPTCAKDIVDEGKNMHHCVGNYVDRVVNGEDYIVFIRHKDTPDQCYITCEVYTNGHIGQYYLAYDNYVCERNDLDFRKAFEAHLQANW